MENSSRCGIAQSKMILLRTIHITHSTLTFTCTSSHQSYFLRFFLLKQEKRKQKQSDNRKKKIRGILINALVDLMRERSNDAGINNPKICNKFSTTGTESELSSSLTTTMTNTYDLFLRFSFLSTIIFFHFFFASLTFNAISSNSSIIYICVCVQ